MLIAIIDYGMGNLRSVSKALELLKFDAEVTRDPNVISNADHVILPGVGAFGPAMENLKKRNLIPVILDTVKSGKPFLGICLGMQLLMESSEEQGSFNGLGIIKGKVIKFFKESDVNPETSLLKIPHMGWNTISLRKESALLKNIPDKSMVYFVHSYYIEPEQDAIAAVTKHGIEYCSIISKNNVFATQFHPEKSGAIGLNILRNFAEVN